MRKVSRFVTCATPPRSFSLPTKLLFRPVPGIATPVRTATTGLRRNISSTCRSTCLFHLETLRFQICHRFLALELFQTFKYLDLVGPAWGIPRKKRSNASVCLSFWRYARPDFPSPNVHRPHSPGSWIWREIFSQGPQKCALESNVTSLSGTFGSHSGACRGSVGSL